jgi:hypothetical protein
MTPRPKAKGPALVASSKPVAKGGDMVKAKKTNEKAAGAGSKFVTGPFLHLPPKTCQSCEQSTHDIDRDCDPTDPKCVVWTKTKTNKNGETYPAGEECYGCFGTRRRYFGMAMDALLEARRSQREVEQKFCVYRRDKVSGENKHAKDSKVEVTQIVKKAEDRRHCTF